MIRKKEGYVAPPRGSIANAVCKLLPAVPRELIEGLGFTALYTIHSEIACYGLKPEAVAEVCITGYRCGRDISGAREGVKQFRRDLKAQLSEAARGKRDEARAKERAGKERARAAIERARARRK
ncbi:MAG: hypothetical protein NTZ78_13070 [Candidatus Aureabacteria bacterium]|nr:hypothetical protein [Candidatus Auribacterota bacterium]